MSIELMPWFVFSFLALVSLAGMTLCVRALTDRGVPAHNVLFLIVAFVFAGFIVMNILYPSLVWRSSVLGTFILATSIAGITSVAGNWFGFEAIRRAPNPGYAVAFKSAAVLPIALLSLVFFGSEWSPVRFLGVLAVLAGLFFLIGGSSLDGESPKTEKPWYLFSAVAVSAFTVMILSIKWSLELAGPQFYAVNMIIFGINFLALTFILRQKLPKIFFLRKRHKAFAALLLASALSFISNMFSLYGLESAPNPAYHEAIKNLGAPLVASVAVVFLSASLTRRKMFGVLMIAVGTTAVVL